MSPSSILPLYTVLTLQHTRYDSRRCLDSCDLTYTHLSLRAANTAAWRAFTAAVDQCGEDNYPPNHPPRNDDEGETEKGQGEDEGAMIVNVGGELCAWRVGVDGEHLGMDGDDGPLMNPALGGWHFMVNGDEGMSCEVVVIETEVDQVSASLTERGGGERGQGEETDS